MTDFLESGKLGEKHFKEMIFPMVGAKRNEVKTGPEYGVDVSVVSVNKELDMAITSDPLSLIPTLGAKESAWLSVHLMANDMATTGLAPQYAQFVLNLPPNTTEELFREYWQYIHEFCSDLGTAITGGHTGTFEGQHSTVAGGGTMISIGTKGTLLTSKGAKPGDVIVVTKESAQVAASILAKSFPETVKDECGAEVQQEASELFYRTSALREGLLVADFHKENKAVSAMHDVTEGGILGAIYELAFASGCGAEIEKNLIPTGTVQGKVCSLFDLDPHECVGAGSMIITVKENQLDRLNKVLENDGIKSTAVGRLTDKQDDVMLREDGEFRRFSPKAKDPYWAAFFKAVQEGRK